MSGSEACDLCDPVPEAPSSGRRKPTPWRRRLIGGAVIASLLGSLAQCLDLTTTAEDRRYERQGQALFAELCADPAAARGLQHGLNTEVGMICPTLGAIDVALPVADLPPGPPLASAYLASLQAIVVTSMQPEPLRNLVAVINRDGLYADEMLALNRKVRACHASPTPVPAASGTRRQSAASNPVWGIGMAPSTVRTVSADTASVRLSVRVVEQTPTCVTDTAPLFGQVTGTTDLDLTFTTGAGPGNQPVWLLTALRAYPVTPDPLLKVQPKFLGAATVRSAGESLFSSMTDACRQAPIAPS